MAFFRESLFGEYWSELSRPIDIYCERTSATWDAEPLNAISNFAFFIAAWAVWRLRETKPDLGYDGEVRLLTILIAVVGGGSLIFHTLATKWAEWVDVIPILFFMVVYLWVVLSAFFDWPSLWKFAALLGFFAATFYLGLERFQPVLWGGAMYLPTILVLSAIGVVLLLRHSVAGNAFIMAAAIFLLSFAARTVDLPLCNTAPFGTHYFWHILNATVLYLLVRTVLIHAPARRNVAQSGSLAARQF